MESRHKSIEMEDIQSAKEFEGWTQTCCGK
jgi:hypothetical protein